MGFPHPQQGRALRPLLPDFVPLLVPLHPLPPLAQPPTCTAASAPAPRPGACLPHPPRFPSAGLRRPERLGPPAAAPPSKAAAGAAGGPAGGSRGSAGRGRPFGLGPAAAPGRLCGAGSRVPRQRPWWDGQRNLGRRRCQLHGGGGCPVRGSPGLPRRNAGPVLGLRAALGRAAAHPVRQQPVGGRRRKGGRADEWAGPGPGCAPRPRCTPRSQFPSAVRTRPEARPQLRSRPAPRGPPQTPPRP